VHERRPWTAAKLPSATLSTTVAVERGRTERGVRGTDSSHHLGQRHARGGRSTMVGEEKSARATGGAPADNSGFDSEWG
jgi:hypothetical protein